MIGNTQIDLTDYALKSDLDDYALVQDLNNKANQSDLNEAVTRLRMTGIVGPDSSVSVMDAIDLPAKVVVDLRPVQSGSSNPAPDNIRTISGYDSVTITRTDGNGGNSQTVTVDLEDIAGGTVYGGTLTINEDGSGTLVSEWLITTLDGVNLAVTSIPNTGTANWMYKIPSTAPASGRGTEIVSSHFPYGNIGNGTTIQGITVVSNGDIRIRWGTEDTATNFNTWLQSNNVQVAYPIAPTTYNFTAEQIAMLLGGNTVSTDVGNLTLTYTRDSGTAISVVEEQISTKYEKPSTGIPASDIASGVIPDVSEFYVKPSTGIPASDLATGVIPDVSGFYTKPSSGIPASDIASGVIPDVSGFYTKPLTGIPANDLASGVIPDVSGFYTKPSEGIPASDLASGVIPDVSGLYTKPASGIPASDIATGVIPDVSGFYTKPVSGIPASDLASGVIPDLTNYVTDTDYATGSTGGVVKVDDGSDGITITANGVLMTNPPTESQLKWSDARYRPITPTYQHASTFYGLAKAAGDTTQPSSGNAIGTYTDDAKTAIRSMIGAIGATDYANTSTAGVVKINSSYGVIVNPSTGEITINPASIANVKSGSEVYRPLIPARQHEAAFYGLAKAAGVDMSSSDNTVGTYTDAAKSAIRTMIGAADSAEIKATINAIHGNILGTPTVISNLYINPNSDKFSSTNNDLSVLVIPITPSCEYTVWKNTSTTMRVAVGSTETPANNGAVSRRAMHSEPSSDKLTISAGPTDTYLYIQLYVSADDEQYKSNAANMTSLIIYTDDRTVVVASSTPSITAAPNTRYLCGECSTLSITPPVSGLCEVRFTSGTTATVLTLPPTVKMPSWWMGVEASKTYSIMISDGVYGAVMAWS